MLYVGVFIILLSQMGEQVGAIASGSACECSLCLVCLLSISVDGHGYLCPPCACFYWEYMLNFAADGTWDMELHQLHLTHSVRADTVYFPLAGTRLENAQENPCMRPAF